MKVLGIGGSHRKGNSEIMLMEALRGAKQAGAKTEIVLLREIDFKHCGGCNNCIKTNQCDIKDKMSEVLEKVVKADALVLTSPTYFSNVSAMMKIFIDRTNYLYESQGLKGKKAAVICVGGQPKNSIEHCEWQLKEFCRIHGIKVVGAVRAVADDPGEIKKNNNALKECFELGKQLSE